MSLRTRVVDLKRKRDEVVNVREPRHWLKWVIEQLLLHVTHSEHCSQHRSCCPSHCGWPAELPLHSGCFCEPVENTEWIWESKKSDSVISSDIRSTNFTTQISEWYCCDKRLLSLLWPVKMCKSSVLSSKATHFSLTKKFIMGFK